MAASPRRASSTVPSATSARSARGAGRPPSARDDRDRSSRARARGWPGCASRARAAAQARAAFAARSGARRRRRGSRSRRRRRRRIDGVPASLLRGTRRSRTRQRPPKISSDDAVGGALAAARAAPRLLRALETAPSARAAASHRDRPSGVAPGTRPRAVGASRISARRWIDLARRDLVARVDGDPRRRSDWASRSGARDLATTSARSLRRSASRRARRPAPRAASQRTGARSLHGERDELRGVGTRARSVRGRARLPRAWVAARAPNVRGASSGMIIFATPSTKRAGARRHARALGSDPTRSRSAPRGASVRRRADDDAERSRR